MLASGKWVGIEIIYPNTKKRIDDNKFFLCTKLPGQQL